MRDEIVHFGWLDCAECISSAGVWDCTGIDLGLGWDDG